MSDAINPDHYKRLPAEAIEIIEAAIDNAPSNQAALLHGQVLKYILRCWHKNGIEDLEKAKWYLDRLIDSFDESEPEQPKPTLNSDKIPDGYRKLNDSSIEPRQRGDLRWSIAEKRYIEIGFDEIGYADRENWAACRKIEPVIKQSLNTEPPDGWRWLQVGEVIRRGDMPKNGDSVPLLWIGTPCCNNQFILRRNKFEVGEKVVHGDSKSLSISVVGSILGDGWLDLIPDGFSAAYDGFTTAYHVKDLAPYIEVTEEVTEEVTGEVKPPDGWRWLEVGEALRKGDTTNTIDEIPEVCIGTKCVVKHFALRRNKFEVGEKVVTVLDEFEFVIIDKHSRFNDVYVVRNKMTGKIHKIQDRLLAPYIEDAT